MTNCLPPARLAAYMAKSARRSNSAGSISGSSVHVAPMLAAQSELADRRLRRLGKGAQEPGGDNGHTALGAQLAAQDDQLVATQPGDGVYAPGRGAQALGGLDQHLVTGIVTVGVVDLLEGVEIDEEHADPARPALERDQGLGQTVHEGHPVGQAGERVVQRLIGQGIVHGHLGGDVTRGAEGPDDGAVATAQRDARGGDPGRGPPVEGLALEPGHHGPTAGDHLAAQRPDSRRHNGW